MPLDVLIVWHFYAYMARDGRNGKVRFFLRTHPTLDSLSGPFGV